MTASKLFEAGYTDLVSVVPPKARLAPTTSLKLDARGKVPGKRRLDGRWVGYPWLKDDPPSPRDIAEWESWNANIGLRADRFPGLDVDVEDPTLATLVIQEAERMLGPAPRRTSRDPRRLLVYRSDEPFTRMAATIAYRGEDHVVEMLAKGRQYLVAGDHPSGTKYGWEGEPLWERAPEKLSLVTPDMVQEFFEHLRELLQGRAGVVIQGSGETKDTAAPPQESLEAPSLEALEDLVAEIPNDYPDRDTYIMFGHAIKAAGGEVAFPVWEEWCSRWTDGENEIETVRADWDRMHPPFRVGWGWLQDIAREHGYEPAQDEFSADPDAQEPMQNSSKVLDLSGVLDFTDTWAVERLADLLAGEIRYVPETGHFHVWGEG